MKSRDGASFRRRSSGNSIFRGVSRERCAQEKKKKKVGEKRGGGGQLVVVVDAGERNRCSYCSASLRIRSRDDEAHVRARAFRLRTQLL